VWLAPGTSTLWLLALAAYHRSKSGLMILSFPATSIQLGLLLHAGVAITAWKLASAMSTWDRALKTACAGGRSAAKWYRPGESLTEV
jgi:hypothetical protein